MYVKYPRTYHLPWSDGITYDDKSLSNIDHFIDKMVVVTEKLDGENTSLYRDYIHARSIDSNNHESRNWVKNFWSAIAHNIPEGWCICGENLYAKHSIEYNNLESYFYGFSIWNNVNECLKWDDTIEWFNLLEIVHVPVLYEGIFDEYTIKNLSFNPKEVEGYVIRIKDSFLYQNFNKAVAKYVRKNHVQTANHWKSKKIVPNKLRNGVGNGY